MYCPNCGSKLPDGVKFCPNCGSRIDINEKGPSDTHIQATLNQAANTAEKPTKVTKNVKMRIIFALLIAGLAILLCIVAIRAANEQSMRSNIPSILFEESQATIKDFYDNILSVSYSNGGYMITNNYDSVTMTKSDKANEFDIEAQAIVTDLTQEDRPEYSVVLSGIVTTNFWRSDYTITHEFYVENPDNADVIDLKQLFDEYSANAPAAENKYAGQYLNVNGEISSIGPIKNDNTVTVELEYYAVQGVYFDVFNAEFEFDASNSDLYNLQVGSTVTLTGYLLTGGSERFIYFSDGSIYNRDKSSTSSSSSDGSNDLQIPDYQGDWGDSVSQRCYMSIEDSGNGYYSININWSSSASEDTGWHMDAQLNDQRELEYSNGSRYDTIYTDDGDFIEDLIYLDGTGKFYFADGYLHWQDDVEQAGDRCLFEKSEY